MLPLCQEKIIYSVRYNDNFANNNYMKSATVPNTPQMWHAWWKSFWSGYAIAASITIHQPMENWKKHETYITTYTYTQHKLIYLKTVLKSYFQFKIHNIVIVHQSVKTIQLTSNFWTKFCIKRHNYHCTMNKTYHSTSNHRWDKVASLANSVPYFPVRAWTLVQTARHYFQNRETSDKNTKLNSVHITEWHIIHSPICTAFTTSN